MATPGEDEERVSDPSANSAAAQALPRHEEQPEARTARPDGVGSQGVSHRVGWLLTPLTVTRHRLSPLVVLTRGAYFLRNGRR